MVYAHTHWNEKSPFNPQAMASMQDGNHEEKLIIQELMEDGFEVVESQVSFDIDAIWATGRIDGKIKWNGNKIPFEVKRLQPFVFDRIESVEDFEDSLWLRKYMNQLHLYMLGHNIEVGLFILSNGLGKRKYIPVELDYEKAEAIWKLCESVKGCLDRIEALKTANPDADIDALLPERIKYDGKICGYCSWYAVCAPDKHFGEGAQVIDAEMVEKIDRYSHLNADLKPLVKELEGLKKEIKMAVEGKEMVLAGNYAITGKWVEMKGNPNPKPKAAYRWWKWSADALVAKTDGGVDE